MDSSQAAAVWRVIVESRPIVLSVMTILESVLANQALLVDNAIVVNQATGTIPRTDARHVLVTQITPEAWDVTPRLGSASVCLESLERSAILALTAGY